MNSLTNEQMQLLVDVLCVYLVDYRHSMTVERRQQVEKLVKLCMMTTLSYP